MEKREYVLHLLKEIINKNYVKAASLFDDNIDFISKSQHQELYNLLVQLSDEYYELVEYFYTSIINNDISEVNYCLTEFWRYDFVSSQDMDLLEFLTDSNSYLKDKKELNNLDEIKTYLRYEEEQEKGHVVESTSEEKVYYDEESIKNQVEDLFETIDEINDSIVIRNLSNNEIKTFKKYLKRNNNLKSFIVKSEKEKYLVINKYIKYDDSSNNIKRRAQIEFKRHNYEKALTEFKKLLSFGIVAENYAKIGLCYYYLNDLELAEIYLSIATDMSKDEDYTGKKYDFCDILSQIKKKKELNLKM